MEIPPPCLHHCCQEFDRLSGYLCFNLTLCSVPTPLVRKGLLPRFTSPPSVLPDISPTRREIGCHRRFRQSPASQRRQASQSRSGDGCNEGPGGGEELM
ncbi:MAG: hypothetical protein E5X83_24890 [Mesorhizobium sp.]|nr:MAG: hypothetical protein EOR82_21920 [Mesorhizobium sp.]TIO22522.1 MAG: hypothetical protein E5X83_24890 [Mesorhizobium sp.]TJV56306.1 MAG: hypothetical protein E5X82_24450 [Mesorhizobium sp.]